MSSRSERGMRIAREIGMAVLNEIEQSRASSTTNKWRSEQVQRHQVASRKVRHHERRLDRADRSLARNTVLAAIFALLAVAALIGGADLILVVLAGSASALTAGRAVHWRRERHRLAELPPPPPPPPLPPVAVRGSVTTPYVTRADRAAQSWWALEPLLGRSQAATPVVVGGVEQRSDEARAVASAALDDINVLIGHVQALERARATAPEAAHAALDGAIEADLAHLEGAVAAFEEFVAATSSLLEAAGQGVDDRAGRGRLQDATDALVGLAAGIREVRAGLVWPSPTKP